MPRLDEIFTSKGNKLLHHSSAMEGLRAGRARPITCHLMPTDICQDRCSFCSVLTREGKVLPFGDMLGFVDILLRYGLKSVIISGGGNPCLWKCPETKAGISELVLAVAGRGLEVGMITNGMKLREYEGGRKSYATLTLEALDSLTWLRVSMSGLDHARGTVDVPDIDPARTTLGFSWVHHDTYRCPEEPNHGQVSTREDLRRYAGPLTDEQIAERFIDGTGRLAQVEEQIRGYVGRYHPRYVRLLPNCLEPARIPGRCAELRQMADAIDPAVVFVQNKPPDPASHCFLGLVHPVLNSDGFCYPCDSVVLNSSADHRFASPWRMCHWTQVADLYERPTRSLIANPKLQCPGCVFGGTNRILESVVDGTADLTPPAEVPTHANFV